MQRTLKSLRLFGPLERTTNQRHRRWRRKNRSRGGIENLERRVLLTAVTVNTLQDVVNSTDEFTSLREAIAETNTNEPAEIDTITFDSSLTYAGAAQITLDGLQLSITDAVTIQGPGANLLSLNANHQSRIFHIDDGDDATEIAVSIDGLTLTGGTSTGPFDVNEGGAIFTEEALTLTNSTLSGNSAFRGGGIFNNSGTVTVSNSTFTGNSASRGGGVFTNRGARTIIENSSLNENSGSRGGGIFNGAGTTTVHSSTLIGNKAARSGGGIFNWAGTTTVTNSTLSENSDHEDTGGIFGDVGLLDLNNRTVDTGATKSDIPKTAPAVEHFTVSGNEDTGITGSLAPTNVGGHTLTFSKSKGPDSGSVVINANDGTFIFEPGTDFQSLAYGETRNVTFDYTATHNGGADQASSSPATVTIIVNGTNDAPVATNATANATEDGVTWIDQLVATDVDNNAILTYTLETEVPGLKLKQDGTYVFNPRNAAYQDLTQGDMRTVVADWKVSDGLLSDKARLTITIAGTDDQPLAIPITISATEDEPTVNGSFSITNADAKEAHAFEITSAISEGTVINNNDGTFSFAPGTNFQDLAVGETREVTFDYIALDGSSVLNHIDINVTKFGANPADITRAGEIFYLTANDGRTGTELWKSDGTQTGTQLVKDILVGAAGSDPNYLTHVNGTLYFTADDGRNGRELWKTDGTAAGTQLVKDIVVGTGSSNPQNLTHVNDTLYFMAFDAVNGRELWKTDGTDAGTQLVKDILAGAGSSDPQHLTDVSGSLYFTANVGASGRELWKSDGTDAGTQLVKDIRIGTGSSTPSALTNVNGTLYFSAFESTNGRELWKSDGTETGTQLVKDIRGGTGTSGPSSLTQVNGTLFFTADDGRNGTELWKSDGTDAGTQLVRDIRVGSGRSAPSQLTDVNGILYFTADDGRNGTELWKSDGTSAGTQLVKDIRVGASSSPRYLTSGNGTLYFTASDGTNGSELWRSDGTDAGTQLVKDIVVGAGSSNPRSLIDMNGILYFTAFDEVRGIELWKSDGTQAGTQLAKEIGVSTASSSARNLTNVNGTLYFTADDGRNGAELWKSGGIDVGTHLVSDINAGAESSNPSQMTDVDGTLYFTANDGTSGTELWTSDGTEAGTKLVKDIRPGRANSAPRYLTDVNGILFFSVLSPTHGFELWKSDGTEAGTQLVKDIRVGSGSSNPNNLTHVNGTLFFTANDGTTNVELWKTDGTEAGTQLVKDIRVGVESSGARYLTDVNGTLYFSAFDTTNGFELWKSDGTETGTQLVKDIRAGTGSSLPRFLTNVNGTLYFNASDAITPQTGFELWKSDGTEAGTQLVKDIGGRTEGSYPSQLTEVNGTLYFTADNETNGRELWKSDGTEAGTQLVKDIHVGTTSSGSRQLTDVSGTLYFTASDNETGIELWKSDGTTTGTQLVKDIVAGIETSSPSNLTNVNGTLYFTADDGVIGQEIFTIPQVNATVTVTVVGTNDQPIVDAVTITTNEDGSPATGNFSVTDNDTNDTHTFAITTQPTEGSVTNNNDGTFTFYPGANFQELAQGETRDVTFQYNATDNRQAENATSATATVTVTITGTNDQPIVGAVAASANEDGSPVTDNFSVIDADTNDTHTFTITTQPTEGSVTNNNDGTFTFDPGADFQDLAQGETRDVTFQYNATDSSQASNATSETATVTVTGTNDQPVIGEVSISANEDGSPVTGNFSVTDTDTRDTYIFAIATQPTEGTVANNNDGTFTFDPGANFQDLAQGETREVTFQYTATDNSPAQHTIRETATVTVTGTNDQPVVNTISTSTQEHGIPVTEEFSVNDADTNDTHTFAITTQPSEGTVTNNNDGTFTFDPGADFQDLAHEETRVVTFQYSATDNSQAENATSVTATITVTVIGTNDVPTVSATEPTLFIEAPRATHQQLQQTGKINFEDVDANALIDITFSSNNDVQWSGGDLDSVLAETLTGGFDAGVLAASSPGESPWNYDVPNVDLTFLDAGETITFSYTITATDSHGAHANTTLGFTVIGSSLVTVEVRDDELIVTGDAGSNSITVQANQGSVTVIGDHYTHVEFADDFNAGISFYDDALIDLGSGKNQLTITESSFPKKLSIVTGPQFDQINVQNTSIERDLIIDSGLGDDAVVLSGIDAEKVRIRLNGDNDRLAINNAQIGERLRIDGDTEHTTGIDLIELTDVFTKELRIDSDSGDDEITLTQLAVEKAVLDGGEGQDRLQLIDSVIEELEATQLEDIDD